MPAVWEVTNIIDGHSFTWMTRSPGLLVETYHKVQRSGTGSYVALSVTYSGPLGGFVARRLAETTHRFLELEAAGLKRRSEGLQ